MKLSTIHAFLLLFGVLTGFRSHVGAINPSILVHAQQSCGAAIAAHPFMVAAVGSIVSIGTASIISALISSPQRPWIISRREAYARFIAGARVAIISGIGFGIVNFLADSSTQSLNEKICLPLAIGSVFGCLCAAESEYTGFHNESGPKK